MAKETYNIAIPSFDQDHHRFCKHIQHLRRKNTEPKVELVGFVVYDNGAVAGQDTSRRIDVTRTLDPNFGMLDEQEVIAAINATYGSTFPSTCAVAKALEVSYVPA